MMEKKKVEAFVLAKRRTLNDENAPSNKIVYDDKIQVWINRETGKSVVLQSMETSKIINCSVFGETTITRTREGADQTEVIKCSEFGETLITETREGVDQAEVIGLSEFGETRLTATQEGVDQAEGHTGSRMNQNDSDTDAFLEN
jgi:hypothetical protein